MTFLNKKFFTIFLGFFLLSLFSLPSTALADGIYQVQTFADMNTNGVYDYNAKNNPQEKTGVKKTVCYDGFVPCGKTLCIDKGLNAGDKVSLDPSGKCMDKSGECLSGRATLPDKVIQCQLCHFFIMIDAAVDYVVMKLVPLLAVFMLVVAGVMFYLGGIRPELLSRAKTLIKGVVIGLLLIYGAYMIVNIFLTVLGAAHVNSISQVFKNGIFSIECPVYVPDSF